MPTLETISVMAEDEFFQRHVKAALALKARSVVEATLTPGAQQGVFGRAYAVAIIRNPSAYVVTASWVVATDPEVAALETTDKVTDEAVNAAVGRAWPALSGLI